MQILLFDKLDTHKYMNTYSYGGFSAYVEQLIAPLTLITIALLSSNLIKQT
jgi:hypothetical protein